MPIESLNSTFRPPSERYEIGVVGAGWISTAYHLPVLDSVNSATVTYVADIDGAQARKASRGYDAKAIEIGRDISTLPECDIVVLAIPVGVRQAYIAEFASRGTAIFSEKPFAVDSEMHRRFVDTAESITCNYMRTHYNATVQLRHVLETGMFGIPERVELVEEGKIGATGFGKSHFQTSSDQSGGGILLERGCHSISQICLLFNEYDISVADAEITWHGALDAEVEARLDISNGHSSIEMHYLISRLRPVGSQFLIEYGDQHLATDPFDPESPLQIEPSSESNRSLTVGIEDTAATTTHQAIYLRWQEFLSRISADEDPIDETMPEVTRLIDQIYQEAK